jgi:putative flippase GtrA
MAELPDAAVRRERILEFIRFCIVGASSTLIYFGVYSGLVSIGVAYGLASIGGWLVSAGSGFLLHHHFTFKADDGHRSGPVRWLLLQGSVLLVNFGGLTLLVHQAGTSRIIAQLILLPFIPLATYVLSRRFVFAQPVSGTAAANGDPVR